MKRIKWIALLATQALLTSLAFAEGDVAQGKTVYTSCVSCHGKQGGGNAELAAPRLSHLPAVYILAQLDKFRSGTRGGKETSAAAQQMAAMAATLTDEQALYDVATYVATLQGAGTPAAVSGDVVLGGDYYNQFCGACHGAAAQGNPALNSPPLAGADDWYLVSQLQAFREGVRGSQPDDKTGRQMRAMASVLPNEKAIADVVAYISSLGNN